MSEVKLESNTLKAKKIMLIQHRNYHPGQFSVQNFGLFAELGLN